MNNTVKTKLKKKNYQPYPGFYDLRIFHLNPREFFAALRIQDYLYQVSKQREYYKRYAPYQWEQIKDLAAQLQMFLLPRLKDTEILR